MTSACTPAILGEIRDSTGRRNANVFPEPVGESSIMSFGRVAVSSICFCMPFSESIFKLRHALSIRADVSFMSAKIMQAEGRSKFICLCRNSDFWCCTKNEKNKAHRFAFTMENRIEK